MAQRTWRGVGAGVGVHSVHRVSLGLEAPPLPPLVCVEGMVVMAAPTKQPTPWGGWKVAVEL